MVGQHTITYANPPPDIMRRADVVRLVMPGGSKKLLLVRDPKLLKFIMSVRPVEHAGIL